MEEEDVLERGEVAAMIHYADADAVDVFVDVDVGRRVGMGYYVFADV